MTLHVKLPSTPTQDPRLVKESGGKVLMTDMTLGMAQNGGHPLWNRQQALPLTSKLGEVYSALTFVCGEENTITGTHSPSQSTMNSCHSSNLESDTQPGNVFPTQKAWKNFE